jgi:hypothetical protein
VQTSNSAAIASGRRPKAVARVSSFAHYANLPNSTPPSLQWDQSSDAGPGVMPRQGAEPAIKLVVERTGITWQLKWHGKAGDEWLYVYMKGRQTSKDRLPRAPSERLTHLLEKYPEDLVEDDLTADFLEILRGESHHVLMQSSVAPSDLCI